MPTMTAPDATAERSDWGTSDLEELATIQAQMAALPLDAPRALLSVRHSVWRDDATSPVRQEIELYRDALRGECRVVGVARDLGVSATKVAPWQREGLGHWLKERAPEFDVLYFWKYDRFVRGHMDLAQMIKWSQDHGKSLVSVREELDLTTPLGQFLANALALVGRIEANHTGERVGNLWEYSRKQEERWFLGSPVYGYTTEKGATGRRLVHDPGEARVVRYMAGAYLRGLSGLSIAKVLNRARVPAPSGGRTWQSKTVVRILKNPSITGVRVRLPHQAKKGDPPVPSYGNDGLPVRVAEPLVSDEDFTTIKRMIESKARKNGANLGRSPFLGVLKHDCGMNISLHTVQQKYRYLRCVSDSVQPCGNRIKRVNPDEVYSSITGAVLTELGHYQVIERRYVRGHEEAGRAKHLQDTIQHYMRELAPGGQFSDGGFMEKMARKNLSEASEELKNIDPSTLVDRWEYKRLGQTFAERWQEGGVNLMEQDLSNAGIEVVLSIDETASDESERVTLNLQIPQDVADRLVMKRDALASPVQDGFRSEPGLGDPSELDVHAKSTCG